jgi:hypothetical protein
MLLGREKCILSPRSRTVHHSIPWNISIASGCTDQCIPITTEKKANCLLCCPICGFWIKTAVAEVGSPWGVRTDWGVVSKNGVDTGRKLGVIRAYCSNLWPYHRYRRSRGVQQQSKHAQWKMVRLSYSRWPPSPWVHPHTSSAYLGSNPHCLGLQAHWQFYIKVK